MNKRIVIIANGEPPTKYDIARWLTPGATLMCADGGARTALALGLHPHIVVGDFDSLTAGELSQLEARGAQLIRHPARKDETDLELALLLAVKAFTTENTEGTKPEKAGSNSAAPARSVVNSNEIVVLGARGGRIDHELANMLLLAMPALRGTHVIIAHGPERLFLIDARDAEASALIDGNAGDLVSLIPFGGDALGVRTTGLEYPLNDESLFIGPARGVSNVLLGAQASVSVRAGMLLAVISR